MENLYQCPGYASITARSRSDVQRGFPRHDVPFTPVREARIRLARGSRALRGAFASHKRNVIRRRYCAEPDKLYRHARQFALHIHQQCRIFPESNGTKQEFNERLRHARSFPAPRTSRLETPRISCNSKIIYSRVSRESLIEKLSSRINLFASSGLNTIGFDL